MKTVKRTSLLAAFLLGIFVALNAFADDAANGRFHDELLDHLVGQWEISGTVHGRSTKSILEAEWVMNHQFLRVYQKSEENVPEINAPFEATFFIGHDPARQRYLAHFISVWGGGDPTEGLLYGSRAGNEIKLVFKAVGDEAITQRFIWEPKSKSWRIVSQMVKAGKEEEPYLDLKAIPAKAIASRKET